MDKEPYQQNAIDDAARRWLVTLSDNVDNHVRKQQDLAAFNHWLNSDSRHREAFDKAQRVWTGLEHLSEFRGRYRIEDLDRFCTTITDQSITAKPSNVSGAGRRLRYLPALAACFALVVAAFLLYAWSGNRPLVYETKLAQLRELTLPDGSITTLGARSEMHVQFDPGERHVTLLKGAAFFSVVKDPQRPFFVTADKTTVRVVGTQFEVRHRASGVSVSVAEGDVQIVANIPENKAGTGNGVPESDQQATTIIAGQQLLATSSGETREIKTISESAPGAWRVGRLYYNATPLADVMADVSRYFDGRIEIHSEPAGNLRITGSFHTERIERVFSSLEDILPVDVNFENPQHVVVTLRD